MFMHKSKKGFTIVELVIVIAVIAILAAVLIPTFSNLVKKANIANDTALAKNINTALAAYDATNGVEDFADVIAAARDAGYIISNLNPTTEGCYFVWESDTNQILLVDSEKNYEVVYANKEGYGTIDNSWYFATSDKTAAAALKADAALANANIKDMVGNVADLAAAIADGGEIYLDESVVLNADNLLIFDQVGKDIVVNLGDSQLTSEGKINEAPIQVANGCNITLNGGIVGAAGTAIDVDGNIYKVAIKSLGGSNVTINDTQFSAAGGDIIFRGNAELNNVTAYTYVYSSQNGNVTLNNCTVTSNSGSIWVTNTINEEKVGTATLTVNSGKYTSTSTVEGNISVMCGTIYVKGGDFFAPEGCMFEASYPPEDGTEGVIIIEGGTFNGKTLAELGVSGLQQMCFSGKVYESNGVYTIKYN